MASDAQSALTLAATVTQYLDLASGLLTTPSAEVTQHHAGPIAYQEILAVTQLISSQQQSLQALLLKKPVVKGAPSPGNETLTDIARRTFASATDLLSLFEDFRINEVDARFSSFDDAVSTKWSPSRRQQACDDLQQLRGELMVNLLIVVRDRDHTSAAIDPNPTATDTTKNHFQGIHISGNAIVHLGDVVESSAEANILSAIATTERSHKEEIKALRKTIEKNSLFKIKSQAHAEKAEFVRQWSRENPNVALSLSEDVQVSIDLAKTSQIRNKLLTSLRFEEMNSRLHKITDAQQETFSWIYNDSRQESSVDHEFGAWLRSTGTDSSRLFWITGKPGSGKSTLLRFLLYDRRTEAYLQDWYGKQYGRRLLTASCFFWSSGTELQKSQQGLLRSLLYELLRQRKDFSQSLFPERWRLLSLNYEGDQPWTDDELRSVIIRFVDECRESILLLVDGLDEYQGSDEERLRMCDLLLNLTNKPYVKVITSSRPWNIYKDAFKSQPQLKIDVLTQGDIKKFLDDSFRADQHFNNLLQRRADAVDLITEIVSRAQGVFLWVRLITRALLVKLRDGAELAELLIAIDEYPQDLEDFFKRLIADLEPHYRREAAQLFSIALEGSEDLLIYYYTREVFFAKRETLSYLSKDDFDMICEQEERRLNARCRGLLEVDHDEVEEPSEEQSGHQVSYEGLLPKSRVDFLHRTARDFLELDDIQEQLRAWRGKDYYPSVALFKASLCCTAALLSRPKLACHQDLELKRQAYDEVAFLKKTLDYARTIDMIGTESAMPEAEYIRSLNFVRRCFVNAYSMQLKSALRYNSAFSPWDRTLCGNAFKDWSEVADFVFLATAANSGLARYIQWAVYHDSAVITLVAQGAPFLQPGILRALSTASGKGADIVKRLFELGANPNAIIGNLKVGKLEGTVWTDLLEHLIYLRDAKLELLSFEEAFWVDVTSLFIKHGALDVVRDDGGGSSKFIRAPDPWRTIQYVFSKTNAKELIALLDKSAHNTWRAKRNRLLAKRAT